jgi:hypothetical protein
MMDTHRTTPTQTAPAESPVFRAHADGSGGADRHSVRAAQRDSLEYAAARNGLRLRHDLLAATQHCSDGRGSTWLRSFALERPPDGQGPATGPQGLSPATGRNRWKLKNDEDLEHLAARVKGSFKREFNIFAVQHGYKNQADMLHEAFELLKAKKRAETP